ncbi:hypothetical protein [Anaerocolumna sp.]|uniref:hypothetical protein n=1 Tax=Anaerocolumna sp. TaxID=2041569 RepID=UPI0028A9AD6D|nr:hypothetical protein [Anaerocolumna sp.]
MVDTAFDKEDIQNRLMSIIRELAGFNVEEPDYCLFDTKYNLSAESFIYILLKASNEFCFEINDSFVNSMTNYSLNNLVDSIMNHTPNKVTNN